MFFHVEREWVEEATDYTPSGDYYGQYLAENIGDDSQEYHRDVDGLRLEVKDFLQNRAKGGQANTWASLLSAFVYNMQITRCSCTQTLIFHHKALLPTYLERTCGMSRG